MIKILDLYAGTQSVRKSIKVDRWGLDLDRSVYLGWINGKVEYEYFGIDIYNPQGNINLHIDLANPDTEQLLGEIQDCLTDDWIPDFIWASPICNWFSTAINAKGGGNFYFEVGEDKIPYPRQNWNITIRDYMWKYLTTDENGVNEAHKRAKMGLQMIENTFAIMDLYKVPFAIENPANNFAKPIYLAKGVIANKAAYCQYGFEWRKYTNIYTSEKIKLNDLCLHQFHKYTMGKKVDESQISLSGYAKRSTVPPELIESVITQLMKGGSND